MILYLEIDLWMYTSWIVIIYIPKNRSLNLNLYMIHIIYGVVLAMHSMGCAVWSMQYRLHAIYAVQYGLCAVWAVSTHHHSHSTIPRYCCQHIQVLNAWRTFFRLYSNSCLQCDDSGTSSISPQSLKQTPIGHYRSHMHAHVRVLTTLKPFFQAHSIVAHFTYVLSLCTVVGPAVHSRIEHLLPMSHHDKICCSSLQGGAPVQWWCRKFWEWQQSGWSAFREHRHPSHGCHWSLHGWGSASDLWPNVLFLTQENRAATMYRHTYWCNHTDSHNSIKYGNILIYWPFKSTL